MKNPIYLIPNLLFPHLSSIIGYAKKFSIYIQLI